MINIRKNIFETNSSSMHSLCISKQDNYTIPDSLYFELDDFGWENSVLDSPEEIASYLYTAVCYIYEKFQAEEYKNYIYEILGKYNCEATFEEPIYDSWGIMNGTIDHGGELIPLLEKIRKSEKILLRLLFSPNSFIITGNDNSNWYFDKMEELDLSKVEVFEKGN